MTVKELITKLLDCPMDAEIDFKSYNEDTETFLCSQKESDIQVSRLEYDMYKYGNVVIHITGCYEGSEE